MTSKSRREFLGLSLRTLGIIGASAIGGIVAVDALLNSGRVNPEHSTASTIETSTETKSSTQLPQTQSSETTTSSTSDTVSSASGTDDYSFWVEPFKENYSNLVSYIMKPYPDSKRTYGFDSTYGMIRGCNIEGYTDALTGVSYPSGYNNGFVMIDSNILCGRPLDYWNALNGSFATQIDANCRAWLAKTWVAYDELSNGNYATNSYNNNDRREALFGNNVPYIYGFEGVGQHWYMPDHNDSNPPAIITEFPDTTKIHEGLIPEPLEYLGPEICLAVIQGNIQGAAQALDAVKSSFSNGNFGSVYGQNLTRTLNFAIGAARALGKDYWENDEATWQSIAQEMWSWQGNDGGVPTGYKVNAGGETPESCGLALWAFCPDLPNWFP